MAKVTCLNNTMNMGVFPIAYSINAEISKIFEKVELNKTKYFYIINNWEIYNGSINILFYKDEEIFPYDRIDIKCGSGSIDVNNAFSEPGVKRMLTEKIEAILSKMDKRTGNFFMEI